MKNKKIFVFGGAGRVGQGLVAELLRNGFELCVGDCIGEQLLSQKVSRLCIDAGIAAGDLASSIKVYGNIDVLNRESIAELLVQEKPDFVVNYAIPFTWDAAKKLNNYPRISKAGLGAFAAVQVLAPKCIAEAIADSGINTKYLVGNLPDITIPVIYGIGSATELQLPIAGAGNVGLIEAAIRYRVAQQRNIGISEVAVALVAHHIHWVAPREPGYRNDAPYLLKVMVANRDITRELGDSREYMNRAITDCYEPGAGFSSTTALLAAKTIMALLDESDTKHPLHVPAPNGLPGGYPTTIQNEQVTLNLPGEWQEDHAIALMKQAHKCDGVDEIAPDGTIVFNQEAVDILLQEIGFSLPRVVSPHEVEEVAREQIAVAQRAIDSI